MNEPKTEQVYEAVKAGWLEVRPDGTIWRIAQRRKARNGKVSVVPIIPRRIDNAKAAAYRTVKFMVDGVQITTQAHRLVWRHFNGPIPRGLQVNHKNGDKKDNRPENLELVTASGNKKHAYRIGLQDEHGEKNPAAILRDSQVAAIRHSYATSGKTQAQIAEEYGVAHQTISKIVRGDRRSKQAGPTADYIHNRQRGMRDRCPITGRFVT